MKSAKEKIVEQPVILPVGRVRLEGDLAIPSESERIVIFAHGSGSSRHSVRNRFVAGALQEGELATLLFDLLSAEEERIDLQTARLRFDIHLLTQRLVQVIDWVAREPTTQDFRIGLFGSSTGAAAALAAAAQRPAVVKAVVSRGGRPDLAGAALESVQAPTLLIVGGDDAPVIDLNLKAQQHLHCENEMKIVLGATHLFEEPGALETVAQWAREWFLQKS